MRYKRYGRLERFNGPSDYFVSYQTSVVLGPLLPHRRFRKRAKSLWSAIVVHARTPWKFSSSRVCERVKLGISRGCSAWREETVSRRVPRTAPSVVRRRDRKSGENFDVTDGGDLLDSGQCWPSGRDPWGSVVPVGPRARDSDWPSYWPWRYLQQMKFY